ELSVPVGHAARHIEHEEHHRMHRRLPAPRELSVTKIFVDEGWGGSGSAAPLHHLLEGTAPVESRAGAAPIPAFTYPVALLGRSDTRLQVGKLHLLPQPVDDVIDLELEQELDFTLVLAAAALLARAALLRRIGEHITRLGLALSGALLLLRTTQT